jgi:hypothetical protein
MWMAERVLIAEHITQQALAAQAAAWGLHLNVVQTGDGNRHVKE